MTHPKFDEKELKVVAEIPNMFDPSAPGTPVYNFPCTPREAYIATMKRAPIWEITNIESMIFTPKVYPDNVARALVVEATPLPREEFGGKDMFGIEWVYVDVAGGSMVVPGSPLLEDANEWQDKLVWPDIDSWDWETSAKENDGFCKSGSFIMPWIMNGYYERLISFMDFEGAILAMIDEEQKQAVKDLFERLTDLYIKVVDKFVDTYPIIDGFCVHDDWGSQKAPFFSPATAMEMVVPAMKRLTDHIHSKGLFADFHSCGHLELQVPAMIAAGWDSWGGMPMNDTQMLYDKYGDKIIIGVIPEQFDPMTTSEEEQRVAARAFVEKCCKPDKPSSLSYYGAAVLTNVYREEVYKQSRIMYCK